MKTDESVWVQQLLADLPEKASGKVEAFAKSIEDINPPIIIYARPAVENRHSGQGHFRKIQKCSSDADEAV